MASTEDRLAAALDDSAGDGTEGSAAEGAAEGAADGTAESADGTAVVPRQRLTPEQELVMADDRLIEAIRTGAVTEDSPVEPVARMLARWRRHVLAEV